MTNPRTCPEALGLLTTTIGVPVTLVTNLPTANKTMQAHYISCQALPGNANNVYVGFSNMVPATGVGLLKILSPGESWSIPPNAPGGNRFTVSDFFMDVAANGEGLIAFAFAI